MVTSKGDTVKKKAAAQKIRTSLESTLAVSLIQFSLVRKTVWRRGFFALFCAALILGIGIFSTFSLA